MEDKRIWFEHILNETKKTVIQAGRSSLRKYPLLRNSLDDLVQDTFLELYKNYDKLQGHENITGWLVETMYRKAKDRAKRISKELNRVAVQIDADEAFERTHSDFSDMPERTYIQHESADELRKALSKDIGEEAYRLLEAYYVQGVPLDHLASSAGITPAALKMRFHRWKKRLQKKRNTHKC